MKGKTSEKTYIDTLAEEKRVLPDERVRCDLLLARCNTLWESYRPFRERRDRVYRYAYDGQWSDTICIDGETMTEREYINRHGNFAFEVNTMKRDIDQISGLYSKEHNEPMCEAYDRSKQTYGYVMNAVMQNNWQLNKMPIMYSQWFQELSLGGLAVTEECYAARDGKVDVWTDPVPMRNFFMDCGYDDPRLTDLSLVGYFKDFPWKAIVKKFGIRKGAIEQLKRYYPGAASPSSLPMWATPEERKNMETSQFYSPADPSLCRVYEVWTKEAKRLYRCHDNATGELYMVDPEDELMVKEVQVTNATRQTMYMQQGLDPRDAPVIDMEPFYQDYWYYRYLTPDGHILEEGESQIANHSHPFSFCAIPFVNGNFSGYMLDKINYQRAINRYLMLDDWVKRSGAKGITMVDERLVPDWMDKKDFARAWTTVNGVLLYSGKPGVETPKQFYASTQQLNTEGIVELLKKLSDDASPAASGALQGKTPYAGTSAAMYAQQSQNASTGLADLYEHVKIFMEDTARKKLLYINATYTEEDYRRVAETLTITLPPDFDYTALRDMEYVVSVKQSTETPVMRMRSNDELKEFLQAGLVTFEEYLRYSDGLPYADALLQERAAQQQQAQQQVPQGGEQEQGGGSNLVGPRPDTTVPVSSGEPGEPSGSPTPQQYGYGGRELG